MMLLMVKNKSIFYSINSDLDHFKCTFSFSL